MIRAYLLATTLVSTAIVVAPPASATGPAPEPRVDSLRTAIAEIATDWRVPGMAVAVVAHDEVVFAEGFGVRELGRQEPVTPQSLFSIGSCTKAFTAAALGLLVEDGRIRWDDPVVRYLHGFEMPDPSDTGRVTIRDLLGHRTGLTGGDLLSWGSSFSRQEIVERIRYLEPESRLRSAFHYDNNTYVAAGEVIPAVTGLSWDELVTSRLLTPLGMVRTVTEVGRISPDLDRASPHAEVGGHVTPIPPMDETNCAAAGAIWSSAADMSHWIRMLLDGGSFEERRILAKPTLDELWTVQIPRARDRTDRVGPEELLPRFEGYGMGWFLRDYRGRKVVSHGGQSDGMVAQVTLVPEAGIGMVIMLNLHGSDAFEPIQHLILDVLLGVADPPDWNRLYLEAESRSEAPKQTSVLSSDVQPRAELLQSYAGPYANPAVGNAEVSMTDDALSLRIDHAPLYGGRLEPLGHDAFLVHRDYPLVESSPIRFHRGASGEIDGFILDPDATEWLASVPYRFERVAAASVSGP